MFIGRYLLVALATIVLGLPPGLALAAGDDDEDRFNIEALPALPSLDKEKPAAEADRPAANRSNPAKKTPAEKLPAGKLPAAKPPAKEKPPSSSPGSEDPNSPDYGRKPAVTRGESDPTVAKILEELRKLSVGGKRNDETDYFVTTTVDIQDKRGTLDYPVIQGLQKAAEQIADFMLSAPQGGFRQWKAIGRVSNEKAAEALVRKAKEKSIEGKLEAFKLAKAGRRSPEDFFVVGTAELNNQTQNADIRFEVLGGTKETAGMLLAFILTPEENTKRQWHVFFRSKTEAEADEYRQNLRNWYDTMESQRAQIAQIYRARTTRRC